MFELLDRDGRNIGEIIDTWAHVDVSFVIFVKKDEQLVPTIFFFFSVAFLSVRTRTGLGDSVYHTNEQQDVTGSERKNR